MNRLKIEKHAMQVLRDAGFGDPPIDPTKIASNLGATVVPVDADDGESGFCLREPMRTIIGVNSAHHINRQRFTIAHEVGHLLLHRGRELIIDKSVRISYRNEVSSMATNIEEMEANAFAAALLMPEDWVRGATESYLKSLRSKPLTDHMADHFKVSAQAMSFRLVNLGIVLG